MSPIPIADLLNALDKENQPPVASSKTVVARTSSAASFGTSSSKANSAASQDTQTERAPSIEVDEPAEEEKLGYLHRVTATEKRPVATNRQGVVTKTEKHEDTRAGHIAMHQETERSGWINLCLRLVGLHQHYAPGELSGPRVSIYFSGMGTKSSPCTVMTDDEFSTILKEVIRRNKKLTVNVVFNVDDMGPWRINNLKRTHADSFEPDPRQELVFGTQVPRTDAYSPRAQLKGTAVGHLKRQWHCDTHKGEHGEEGYCWIAPDGRHVPLNNYRFDGWSSAMVDGEASKYTPPDSLDLDGNSSGTLARPRGRGGPRPSASTSAVTAAAPVPDINTLLSVAVASLIGQLPRAQPRSATPPPVPSATVPNVHSVNNLPISPVPPRNTRLRTCLADFYQAEEVDARACEDAFARFDIGPDIIPSVPVARLGDLTHLSEGNVLRLQRFCTRWQARLDAKLEKN
ncbi:hypothetical protein EXIGLDRAFT_775402 [Exidia glandulosa HHB12029]|uniref:Uncharacterized protein n=1 Tax=Exidia glandulosa HHB12029 TaxID=1314781 RepID=A0A165DXW3_EXIGL|nr:hypothetical protein EXIGLDRAFT_775402 [Exidia glandulosa HHB12029]